MDARSDPVAPGALRRAVIPPDRQPPPVVHRAVSPAQTDVLRLQRCCNGHGRARLGGGREERSPNEAIQAWPTT